MAGIDVFDELPPPPEKPRGVKVHDSLPESGDVTVGNVARAVTRGVPFFGAFRDETAARIQAGVNKITGGRAYGSYEENLAKERARDRAFQEQNPVLDLGLGVAGGIGGTVAAAPAVAGAGVAGAVGRTALGLGARTLPGAVARGGTAGGMQGLFSGLGAAEGDVADRGVGGLVGAAVGGGVGAALPGLLGGAHRVVSGLYNQATGTGGPLSNLSGAAQRYIGSISTPDALSRIQQGIARLGPEAMLADVSPEWNAIARGAAARPGGRDAIVQPLEDRAARANAAIQAAADQNLGPAPIPSRVDADIRGQQRALGPAYNAVEGAGNRIDTEALAQRLEAQAVNLRGAPREAVLQARQMLNVPGTNQLDPNPSAIHSVREALDGLMRSTQDTAVQAQLQAARSTVDDLLAQGAPGIKQIDAQYAELARQREALERGQTLLDTGRGTVVRPAELQDDLARMAGPLSHGVQGPSAQPYRLQQGLRAEVDRLTGTAGNDALAINRAMRGSEEAGDWNPRKMSMVFGDEPAQRFLGEVERRVAFQNTRNRVTGGSDTAQTTQFNRAVDALESPVAGAPSRADVTATGLALNTIRRIDSVIRGAVGQARANRFASELGGIAVAQGTTRNEFLATMRRIGLNRAQQERVLDMATRGGLIVSREADRLLPDQNTR